MQSSLNAFDPSKKKVLWKVIFLSGNEKRIVYESAYSEGELEQKYTGANNIVEVKKR